MHFLFLKIRARSLIAGVGRTRSCGTIEPAQMEELGKLITIYPNKSTREALNF